MKDAVGTDRDAKLLEELNRCSCFSDDQVQKILAKMDENSLGVFDALAALKLDLEPEISEIIASVLDVPYIDLDHFEVSQENLGILSRETVYKYKVLPLFQMGNSLTVGMTNPTNTEVIDTLREESSLEIEPCLVSRMRLERSLVRCYPESEASLSKILDGFDASQFQLFEQKATEAIDSAIAAPVAKAFLELLTQAVRVRSSDIHVEPGKNVLRIRYRIDGVLHDVSELPGSITRPMISHIKVLCSLQITETRRPHDGRYQAMIDGREIDMRVSIVPTIFGESVVIRLLGAENLINRIGDLGFSQENFETLDKILKNPWGMVLASGPTGSGKTTTLFALLEKIKSREKKVITIEDPVEYKLEDIRQIHVNQEIGLTFAAGLRSILRQDPDIVLVGEIRDPETASIATQAALTGHLVLSTLHTNDAAGAVVRLMDMGVDPYLISSSLLGVVGQRLVRRICPQCMTESEADAQTMREMGIELKEGQMPRTSPGCPSCLNTGYIGRIAIAEVLMINEKIRQLIMTRATSEEIGNAARSQGMATLVEEGIRSIVTGTTTLSEVVRTISLN